MARELHNVPVTQTQNLLEPPPNSLQHLLTLGRGPSVLVARDALAHGPCPESDTVKSLAHVDHHAHHFVVVVIFQSLADGRELGVQPKVVDGDGPLVAELERPFAAVLVLGVFPFGPDAFLEEVVVCLQAKIRGRRDVVLLASWLVGG